jgi:hypothetical protein
MHCRQSSRRAGNQLIGYAGQFCADCDQGRIVIFGTNEPLMVIDGVPVDNSETGNLNSGPGTNRIADIDPSIIASITY